jgi:NAD(P)-dependent dehydrogenase (short-subunit alcohol dehydrogenase family)
MKPFESKTVLITGGTSGIGKATALAFAKEGANVANSGRRAPEGEEVARQITQLGGTACSCRAMSPASRTHGAGRGDGESLWRSAYRLQQCRHRGSARPADHRAEQSSTMIKFAT